MDKIFERIMFVISQLRTDESHPEFNEWSYRWEKDHASIEAFYDADFVMKEFEKINPIPEHTIGLINYIMADSTTRHNTMALAKAWTSNMIPGYRRSISIEDFELFIEISEAAVKSEIEDNIN